MFLFKNAIYFTCIITCETVWAWVSVLCWQWCWRNKWPSTGMCSKWRVSRPSRLTRPCHSTWGRPRKSPWERVGTNQSHILLGLIHLLQSQLHVFRSLWILSWSINTVWNFAICHESVHFWVMRNWMFDRLSVQMKLYMHISIFYIYMIKFLNCRARTPVSCPCEEMFKLWTRDDLEDQKIRRVRTNWTRCWASGQTLDLKTACSSLLRFYIGCQGYPSCRSAIWFPDFVLDASVSDVKCETVSW